MDYNKVPRGGLVSGGALCFGRYPNFTRPLYITLKEINNNNHLTPDQFHHLNQLGLCMPNHLEIMKTQFQNSMIDMKMMTQSVLTAPSSLLQVTLNLQHSIIGMQMIAA